MRYICFLTLTFIFYSCSNDLKIKKSIEITEFQHVIEDYNSSIQGYEYSYYHESLDSIEVKELSNIFDKKGFLYFISSEGKLYYKSNQMNGIGMAFVFDRELVDIIIKKDLPKSQFVKEIISKLNQIPQE